MHIQGLVQVSRPYLCALLSAAEHKKPVPHCAEEGNSIYMQILDPAWKKPLKQRRLQLQQQFVDEGEWAEVEEEKKKPKQER